VIDDLFLYDFAVFKRRRDNLSDKMLIASGFCSIRYAGESFTISNDAIALALSRLIG
jgi:hypothetical protein